MSKENFDNIISDCLKLKDYSELDKYLSNLYPFKEYEEKKSRYRLFSEYVWGKIKKVGIEDEIIDYIGCNSNTGESEIGCVPKLETTPDVYAGILHFLFHKIN